jgi:aspartyl-tRNA(Asn)/glutamyl-tRNA(Gln) amidotransferase subunit A
MGGHQHQSRAVPPAGIARDHDDALTWLPGWRVRQLIVDGEVSPTEVVDHFLARIEALDPVVHAFRAVDVDGARRQAAELAKSSRGGEPSGPLHGIPVAVKEHLQVRGSPWHDLRTGQRSVSERDCIEVQRLRAAGAIILGSTVAGLTPLEFGASHDQPLNPWDLRRVPGDSSGGTASAVAAGLTPIGLAVDGRGSTRLPAAFCGLVGVHPSRGRVPSYHEAELNPRLLSTSGPMTRDVRDAAVMLGVLSGSDDGDLWCRTDEPPDYLADIDRDLDGVRVAFTGDYGYGAQYFDRDVANAVIAQARQTAFTLRTLGVDVYETERRWPDPDHAASVTLGADRVYVTRREPPLDDVVAAREGRRAFLAELREELDTCDVVASPTILCPAPLVEEWAQRWSDLGYMTTYSSLTCAANLLGWPALSVPAGFVDGVPVGLQLMGPPDSEPLQFAVAERVMRR